MQTPVEASRGPSGQHHQASGSGSDLLAAPVPRAGAHRADVARSVRLFQAFRVEQTDPARFYTLLAADSVAQVATYVPLAGAVLLDVGGGPGYFSRAFAAAGADYLAVDADAGELAGVTAPGPGATAGRGVVASGTALPVRTASVDVCYSSNVLEHVATPWTMAEEMVRVTRPGGTLFLSYNNWLAPNGGHETAPWHYLGGHYARRRYEQHRGRPPKNAYGTSLFRVSVSEGLRWARAAARTGDVDVVDVLPRYHPSWARAAVRVPGLREVATWNLVLVLRRRGRR